MLLTTCPKCSAQFKVQPEQLNIRQGRVMCGRCRDVFNAFQSLTRIEDEVGNDRGSTPESIAVERETSGNTFADPLFLREEPSALPQGFSAPRAERQVLTPGNAAAIDLSPAGVDSLESIEDLDDIPFAARPRGEQAAAPPVDLSVERGPFQAIGDNPLLLSAGDRRETPPARTRGWIAGSTLLVLALGLQAAYFYRAAIAQTVPETRAVLVKACDYVGCTVAWGRDDNAIKIEASDLVETPDKTPGKTGRILLTATVANRGKAQQDFPFLELKLTDNGNQVLLSRVLTPAEYLGRTPTREEGLAANAELFLNLTVELASKMPASGYGVRAFYP